MLSRNSLSIADKLGNPIERLTKKREKLDVVQEFTFKPKINKLPNYLKNSFH